jgi:hypothetical protein
MAKPARIHFTQDGIILSAGYSSDFAGFPYSQPLPADFLFTYSAGKYRVRFVGSGIEVYEVKGWTPPHGAAYSGDNPIED